MAPAPTARVASALPFSSSSPSGVSSGCTIPAVAMAATSDEPCRVFIIAATRNRTSSPGAARAEQTLAEEFCHAGLLAEPLQAAGGTDDHDDARDVAEDAPASSA